MVLKDIEENSEFLFLFDYLSLYTTHFINVYRENVQISFHVYFKRTNLNISYNKNIGNQYLVVIF